MDFVAIDFETADQHYICAVGIVTVENDRIVDEYYTLVQPPYNKYSYFTIRVHGITPEDTEDSPLFSEIYPEIEKRLANKLVVAHNEQFDRNVLMKSMRDHNLDYSALNLAPRWVCTSRICRSRLDKYPSGKLHECCEVDNIELNHHEALSDARACAKLYLINGE
jgi:DNA polymerase-3 subunit epsilon